MSTPSDPNEEMPSEDVLRGMDEAMREFPNVGDAVDLREPPKRFCEVLSVGRVECGKRATHAYPAMGGGYMSLCQEHAKKHPDAWPMKEIV